MRSTAGRSDPTSRDPDRHGAEPIRVLHRTGQWCPGLRAGNAAAYDMTILPEYRSPTQPSPTDRCHLLLDQGIQLTRPGRYTGTAIDGWWYVDLVEVETRPDGLVVHDRYVDFLVPPEGDRYDVLDLDELADALAAGDLTADQCASTLRRTQRFIDENLRSPSLGPDVGPREFPPASVLEWAALPPFG